MQRETPDEREPDYRFTLANERTFLAWIRTCFGLLAGGVAVQQFAAPFEVVGARRAIAFGCLTLALILSCGAYVRWRQVQRAMRRGQPLPSSPLLWILAAGTVAIAVLALSAVLLL